MDKVRWLSEEFWSAASVETVRTALDWGASLEATTEGGLTLLHLAAANSKDPAVVTALLNRGAHLEAKTTSRSATPLHLAASRSTEPAVVALLLDRGANLEAEDSIGRTPLHTAAAHNTEPAVVALLLDRGANLEAKDSVGRTPLYLAAANSTEPAVVALLLDRGANLEALDRDGWTPLHAAAFRADLTVVATLLDYGPNLEALDRDGWKPLHAAAAAESYGSGETKIPIDYLSEVMPLNDKPAVLALLLDRGTHLEARDRWGRTPLDLAIEQNDTSAIQVLRRHGA